MLHHHLLVDGEEDILLGCTEHNLGKMTRSSQVNIEGTRLGVHASSEHDVLQDVLLFKMLSIENDLIVDDLSNETERRLGTESINGGHVEIVHEED
jgi:hypothetical protein